MQGPAPALASLENFFRRLPIGLITQMVRMSWFVVHNAHMPLIDRVAAEVHVEFHFFLQHHDELAGVLVSPEKFIPIMQSIDVLPAASCERLEKRGPADVVENSLPIERVNESAKRFC